MTMMKSEVYEDYSDNRIANMELVLDESELSIKDGVLSMVKAVIAPYIDSKDWSMIAEWNFDSMYGGAFRHLDMCQQSFEKTKDDTAKAIRMDQGNEISKNILDRLLFRSEAQVLNIRRATVIVEAYEDAYKEVYGEKYTPKALRVKKATAKDKVVAECINFTKERLAKLQATTSKQLKS